MRISVSAPGHALKDDDREAIERDLEKLSRRFQKNDEAAVSLRLTGGNSETTWHAVLELDYGRNHLVAKSDAADMGQAVRTAREEILRQVNDRTKRGHSSFAKER